jgi:hypothetical protein
MPAIPPEKRNSEMKRFSRAGRILRLATLMLLAFGLTACAVKTPVILTDSKVMKIQKGDLCASPEFQGWGISDNALAKLLEAAEKCVEK